MIEAITEVANVIRSTMGPYGRKVALQAKPKLGYPNDFLSRDGVTVAKFCEGMFDRDPSNPGNSSIKNMAAGMLLGACQSTVSNAGDGTSTTAVIAADLLRYFPREENIRSVIEEVNTVFDDAIEFVKKQAQPITLEGLKSVGVISSNNNVELGEMIAEMVHQLGPDSYVKVGGFRPSEKTRAIVKNGYVSEAGPLAIDFMGGHSRLDLKNPLVAIVEQRVSEVADVKALLEPYFKSCFVDGHFTRPLVIFAADIYDDALFFLMRNSKPDGNRPAVPVMLIKAPESGRKRRRILEDMEVVTGAKMFSKENPLRANRDNNIPVSVFGELESIEITLDACRMVPVDHRRQLIDKHAMNLQKMRKDIERSSAEDVADDFLEQRISKLRSGVGVIYIGGDTPVETQYLNQAIEDCVLACQSAVKTGVVYGAGWVLRKFVHDYGVREYIANALLGPSNQVFINAGFSAEQFSGHDPMKVLNAETGQLEWVTDTRILDPAGVIIESLVNARSLFREIAATNYAVL